MTNEANVVYYKGTPYEYKVSRVGDKRMFSLFTRGILQHFLDEDELDKKSVVSNILDGYFKAGTSASTKASTAPNAQPFDGIYKRPVASIITKASPRDNS